jgi:carbohydrate-binding DOMON domain-containing protein
LDCINWLTNNPLNQEIQKRQQANAFFLQWLTGTSNVSIEMNAEITNYTKQNPDLMMIYMAGWAKYALKNGYSKDKFQGNLAGYKSIIKYYKAGNGVKKDKNTEKLVKIEAKGELEKWLKSKKS